MKMKEVVFSCMVGALIVVTLAIPYAESRPSKDAGSDLEAAASGRFFDLGSLFNKYPSRPYYPSNGYYPSSGSYPSSGYYPNTGYYPQGGSGGYYPGGGTNMLGGGGYGGYGGNGGLHSYSGYLDNDYYGRRNLGYGYYRGTNNFGFYRSGYSQPEQVSGYRGYD